MGMVGGTLQVNETFRARQGRTRACERPRAGRGHSAESGREIHAGLESDEVLDISYTNYSEVFPFFFSRFQSK